MADPAVPLTVIHVISGPMAGGAEIYVKDLAKALVQRGVRPVIGFVGRARDFGQSAEFERDFLAEIDAAGIAYFFIGYCCRRNPLLGALRVRRMSRAYHADLYHSHLKYALAFGALLRVPHVHTNHNSVPGAPLWLYRLFNRLVDSYVGISGLCAALLADYAGRPVTTIRNGIDRARFGDGAKPRTLDNGRIECIAVGRIAEQKDYATLVDALAQLPADLRAAVHLSLVGTGEPAATAALHKAIADAGLADTITLLGTRGDVPQLLARAQLFVMSSAWEGMPIALLEATASGLPFIATDVGGCAELAALCGNGIVVPSGDPAALAAAITSLLRDPARLTARSRNALASAHLVDIRAAADQHVALYRRLVAHPPERPTQRPAGQL